VDILVSVGGGSPIDSAKIIAYHVHKDTGKWLPSSAIPTTLSVAETTQVAGYTNEDGVKTGVADVELVPKGKLLKQHLWTVAIIYDGDLSVHTPQNLWLSTGMRAVDHAMELLYHPIAPEYPTKRLALSSLQDLFKYLVQSKNEPDNVDVRQLLFLAAFGSLFPISFEGALGLSHGLGHALGASYSVRNYYW
jgi:alcohol dehydrogenase class IV